MPITTARRIYAMNTIGNVKRMMRCDDSEAARLLAEARSVCATADAKKAVKTLNELAGVFGMTTEQMLHAFA